MSLPLRAALGLAFAGLLALALGGCTTSVSRPAASATTSTDEVWYVKEQWLLYVFRVSSDVYYCPPSREPGRKVCTAAVMHEDEPH